MYLAPYPPRISLLSVQLETAGKKSLPTLNILGYVFRIFLHFRSFSECVFQHVEQLLRTLHLNSPDPNLSPVSNTSAPLTPTDLSPTREEHDVNLNLKHLHSPYEVMSHGSRGHAYLTHHPFLEPISPTRPSNSPPYLSSQQGNITATNSGGLNYPLLSHAPSYPIFKSYHEQSSPTPLTAPSLPSAPSYALYHPSAQVNLSPNHQLYAAISAQYHLAQTNTARRADIHGLPRTSIQGSTGTGLAGEWHIPQQVLSAPSLQSSASNMQYQQQHPQPQQPLQAMPLDAEWLRADDGLSTQSGGMSSASSSATSSASATPTALLTLDLPSNYIGTGGLEDSIHAPPSLRSSTSTASSGYISHQQPPQIYNDGHHQYSQPQHHNRHSSSTGTTGHGRETSSSPTHGAHEVSWH